MDECTALQILIDMILATAEWNKYTHKLEFDDTIIAAAVKAIAPTQYRNVLAQLKGEVNSESV